MYYLLQYFLARQVLDYYQVIKGKLASAIKAHAQYPLIYFIVDKVPLYL